MILFHQLLLSGYYVLNLRLRLFVPVCVQGPARALLADLAGDLLFCTHFILRLLNIWASVSIHTFNL